MNRKGNYSDIAEWINVALILGLTITITLLFVSNWNTTIQAMNETVIPADAKVGIENLNTALPKGFDWLFVGFFLIFVAFSVSMARLIPSSPKFIIVTIMVLIILPFISLIIENIWNGWGEQSKIASVLTTIPMTNFMMSHLVYFIILYSLLVAISLLTKND